MTETNEKVDENNKRIREIIKNKKIQKENKLKGNNMNEFFKVNQNNPKSINFFVLFHLVNKIQR